jgi:hypothetical protein
VNTARTAPASGLIVAPGQHAADAHELLELAKLVLECAAVAERTAGTGWQTIGQAVGGTTRANAHGRFAAAVQALQARAEDGLRECAAAELDEAWARVVALAERRARRAEILRAVTDATPGLLWTAADGTGWDLTQPVIDREGEHWLFDHWEDDMPHLACGEDLDCAHASFAWVARYRAPLRADPGDGAR